MPRVNYRLIANQIGDLLKYDTTLNEINRAAKSVFQFAKDTYPNESITSLRAKEIYDWVLTLASQKMNNDCRNNLLIQFILLLTPKSLEHDAGNLLKKAGIGSELSDSDMNDFLRRNFHESVHKHCRELFIQGNYFHAVFEAAKVYNKMVQEKAHSEKDGQSLMLDVLSVNGVLKLNKNETQTERNVQDGVKFLSAGLMQAMRNPTAHEPALDWVISKEDCLDMLSFISYLFKQLDKAVYYNEKDYA